MLEGIEILRSNKQLTKFAQQIHKAIQKESKRGNMLARDVNDIKNEVSHGKSFIALLDGKFVSYVAVYPWKKIGLVEVISFITNPVYRGHGIGTELVAKAFDLTKKEYSEFAIIALANKNSERIFKRQGLVEIAKSAMPDELWDICPDCKEFRLFPNCHCVGLIEQ